MTEEQLDEEMDDLEDNMDKLEAVLDSAKTENEEEDAERDIEENEAKQDIIQWFINDDDTWEDDGITYEALNSKLMDLYNEQEAAVDTMAEAYGEADKGMIGDFDELDD